VCSLTVIWSTGFSDDDPDNRKIRRSVVLQGILGGKVLLAIDGEREMLAVGDAPVKGVMVTGIHPDNVQVKVDGEPRQLKLGDSDVVTAPFKERESVVVTISKDPAGMYSTSGTINGLPVDFLVDTGASSIAMNTAQARRLAVDFRVKGIPTMVNTAGGVVGAHFVKLDKVTVGGITLTNVDAVVLEGHHPQKVLLGMSFLGQLEIKRDASTLRLEKKF